MKYSIYNSILTLNSKYGVLYSGLTDQFVVFKKELAGLLNKNIEELKNESKDLYDKLVKADAIIPDDKNEFLELKKLSNSLDESPQSCKLIINPTMDCNFKCWYCYENHIPGSEMDKATVESIKLFINHILKNKDIHFFDLSFFGGEPLLQYPIVKELIDHTRKQLGTDINYHIGFTSNGYLLTPEILDHLCCVNDSKSFQITLDGDKEKHNKVRYEANNRNSYDVILSNVRQLLSRKIYVILRINYTANNILSVKNILSDIKDIPETDRKFLKISFHRVWQDRHNDDTGKSDISQVITTFKEEFKNTQDELTMNNLRYPCYGDKKGTLVINYNGDVFKCTARDFNLQNRYGILLKDGSIAWDEQKISIREKSKMNKDICKACKILPLCGGGCAQNSIEQPQNECFMGYDDADKNEILLNHLYYHIINLK